jgi:hypothetical protein
MWMAVHKQGSHPHRGYYYVMEESIDMVIYIMY